MNLCKCIYAKPENGGGDSVTWYYVCRLSKEATDPDKCSRCKHRRQEQKGKVKNAAN